VEDLRESFEDALEVTLPGLPTGAMTASEGLSEFPLERPPTGLAAPGEMGLVMGIAAVRDEVPVYGSDLALFLVASFKLLVLS
jgi:hypothetical protein